MNKDLATCSVCPRLCRHACPVATATGREAAVPTLIAGVLVDNERGKVSDALARQAATLCTDCGACQDACHLHQPLPEVLRDARARLLPEPELPDLPTLPPHAHAVVLQVRDGEANNWAARHDAQPVVCPHRLGWQAREHPAYARRLASIQALMTGRRVYTQDGGIAQVLTDAEVTFSWCVTREDAVGSCVCAHGSRPQLACCGGGGPLKHHHPHAAKQLAHAFAERLPPDATVLDQRCVSHLRASGIPVNGVWGPPSGESS